MTRTCYNCKSLYKDGAKFCVSCGKAVTQGKVCDNDTCSFSGKIITDFTDRYCQECGTFLEHK